MAPVALFILSVLADLVVLHSAEYSEEKTFKECPAQSCRNIGVNISFPFKSAGDPPHCGLFTVDCSDSKHPKIQLKEGGYRHELFRPLTAKVPIVQTPFPTSVVFLNDAELAGRLEKDRCDDGVFYDLSLPSASPSPDVVLFTHNLTLLKCYTTLDKNSYPHLKDDGCGNAFPTYYIASKASLPNPPPPGCATIQVPMRPNQPKAFSSLTAEFKLQVGPPECLQCYEREGECLVEEGTFKVKCTKVAGEKQLKLKLGLGIGLGFPVLLAICGFLLLLCKQKRLHFSPQGTFLLSHTQIPT